MDTGPKPSDDNVSAVSPQDLGLPRSDELYGYDARQSPVVFANAPWYQARHLRSRGLLTQYAEGSGYLSDGLSMRAVRSRDYTRRVVVSPVALKPQHQPCIQHHRAVFVIFTQQRISRTRRVVPILAAWDLDTWA